MPDTAEVHFSSSLPIIIYSRNPGEADWQEVDRGPGYFNIPADQEVGIRIKGIEDKVLQALVKELEGVENLRYLDLSENRNLSNNALAYLKPLRSLTALSLSSTNIASKAIEHLKELPNLQRLNLSYCNRLTDPALKTLESMRSLEFVDLKSCLGITKAALSRVRRRNLTINR